MLVGTGGSLGPTGSGTITATSATGVNGAVVPASAGALSTNSSRQLIAVTTTGTGNAVLATSPTLTTPNIGAGSGTSLALTGAGGEEELHNEIGELVGREPVGLPTELSAFGGGG